MGHECAAQWGLEIHVGSEKCPMARSTHTLTYTKQPYCAAPPWTHLSPVFVALVCPLTLVAKNEPPKEKTK